jgi:hypothetical protein
MRLPFRTTPAGRCIARFVLLAHGVAGEELGARWFTAPASRDGLARMPIIEAATAMTVRSMMHLPGASVADADRTQTVYSHGMAATSPKICRPPMTNGRGAGLEVASRSS